MLLVKRCWTLIGWVFAQQSRAQFSLQIARGLASQSVREETSLEPPARSSALTSCVPQNKQNNRIRSRHCLVLPHKRSMHRRLWAVALLASLALTGVAGARFRLSMDETKQG